MGKCFVVFDCKSEAYSTPFFARATGEAIRGFTDQVNNPQDPVSKHASDFTLFEIGEYDEHTGEVKSYETKRNLGCGIDFVRAEQPGIRAV